MSCPQIQYPNLSIYSNAQSQKHAMLRQDCESPQACIKRPNRSAANRSQTKDMDSSFEDT